MRMVDGNVTDADRNFAYDILQPWECKNCIVVVAVGVVSRLWDNSDIGGGVVSLLHHRSADGEESTIHLETEPKWSENTVNYAYVLVVQFEFPVRIDGSVLRNHQRLTHSSTIWLQHPFTR